MTLGERISNLLYAGKRHRDGDEAIQVRLREVSLREKPYPQPDPNTVFCVDIHDQSGLTDAIEYARQVHRPRPGKKIEFIPRLFALVNVRSLSPHQKWQVNKQLIPAGASIFPYPSGCESFEQAKVALESQLVAARRHYVGARKNLKRRNRVGAGGAAARLEQAPIAGVKSATATATSDD
jgi:hypothetical protein